MVDQAKNLQNWFSMVLIFTFVISIVLGVSLISYVAIHDYGGVELINIGDWFVSQGYIDQSYVTTMEEVLIKSQTFPSFLDKLFFLSFAIFAFSLVKGAYEVKREGYFSFFGITIIGSMIILFLLSIYLELSEWIKELLFSAIPSISPAIPIFTWYLNNVGIINMVLIFICIIVNFVDFDFTRFNTRKDKEFINDEI